MSVEAEFESLPLERLEREISELAAHIHAATCRWLLLVAELDRRQGWAEWGCRSCADWLSLRCGVAPGVGREHVRVARRLCELPLVRAAFSEGRLSYSKARAVTRVATSENEAELVELALHATAAQLERIVRSYRGVVSASLEAANRTHEERYLHWSWADDGSLLLHARLPAEDGAVLLKALEAARDGLRERESCHTRAETDVPAETRTAPSALPPEAPSALPPEAPSADEGAPRSPSASAETPATEARAEHQSRAGTETTAEHEPRQSNADALLAMAEALLASGPATRTGGERYQLVLHTDTGVLRDDSSDGPCHLEDGPALPAESARRIACDASIIAIAEREGRPLSVGRKTRVIPPAMRRALRSRDGGCRFPGCSARRFVDAHHIHHWAHGGETKLSNLVLLCRHHHRLLHEGGFSIERHPGDRLTFRRPDGRRIRTTPARDRGDHRQLPRQNRARGVATIDPETPVALSRGARFELAMAVDAILAAEEQLA